MAAKLYPVKCAECGADIGFKTWDQLIDRHNNYCPEHRNIGKKHDADDEIMQCIRDGTSYWTTVAPRWCRERGAVNCLDCPLSNKECIVPVNFAKI